MRTPISKSQNVTVMKASYSIYSYKIVYVALLNLATTGLGLGVRVRLGLGVRVSIVVAKFKRSIYVRYHRYIVRVARVDTFWFPPFVAANSDFAF
jgi:hypothetical protein